LNRDLVKGMAIGASAALLVPVVFPILARVGRPAMGAAMRAGVAAWDKGREAFAEFSEYAEDMAAEARLRRGAPAADSSPPAERPSNGQSTSEQG
jgi:hypothetical protein